MSSHKQWLNVVHTDYLENQWCCIQATETAQAIEGWPALTLTLTLTADLPCRRPMHVGGWLVKPRWAYSRQTIEPCDAEPQPPRLRDIELAFDMSW
jgi:hypothetical protein